MELLILGAVAVGFGLIYNALVRLREQAEAAWADIEVQLKRRYDLIPNLVETVKGYASHESKTLEAVVAARSSAMSASGPAQKGAAEGMLAGALKSLFALSEAYPDLKAQSGFRDLQGTLGQLEEQISKARRYYNAVVRDYNTKCKQLPSNLIAGAFRFEEKEFFEIPEAEMEAPRVRFDESE